MHDSIQRALQYMADFHIAHMPVVKGDKLAGTVSEEDLMDVNDENSPVSRLQESFSFVSVQGNLHIFETLRIMVEKNLSTIAVTEADGVFLGTITGNDLLHQIARYTGVGEKGGLIVLSMDRHDYSFSQLGRLVETNDAFITQLNTSTDSLTGEFLVLIKVNKFEISDIVATFQRFEYNVKYYCGDELYVNELKDNYDHLMNYLSL